MSGATSDYPVRTKSETALAAVSIVAVVVHAVGEGYYQLRWGQPFAALFPDIVAILLLLTTGLRSLTISPRSALALLATGWSFLTCLAYRAAFALDDAATQTVLAANGEPPLVGGILSILLLFCAIGFCWALCLAWRASSGTQPT